MLLKKRGNCVRKTYLYRNRIEILPDNWWNALFTFFPANMVAEIVSYAISANPSSINWNILTISYYLTPQYWTSNVIFKKPKRLWLVFAINWTIRERVDCSINVHLFINSWTGWLSNKHYSLENLIKACAWQEFLPTRYFQNVCI